MDSLSEIQEALTGRFPDLRVRHLPGASAIEHVRDALEFTTEVLDDRLVLWSCLGAGGTYPVGRPSRLPRWLVRRYLWSGPLSG